MKAIVHRDHGGPDVLRLVERDLPEPGPGEVRVRVAVSAVNPTDVQGRSGNHGPRQFPEVIPHLDGAGVIDAVGEGVDRSRIGERVWLYLAAAGRPTGTAAEFTTVPADQAVPLPEQAGFEVGAALGVPALTAHRALTVAEDGPRRLRPGSMEGKVVLAAGGAGAVGHAVIQLARWAGATVISTVSGPDKARLATAAGAHHVVNYREGDPAAEIRTFAPDGVDLVAEVALGANLALDLAVLRPRGTISTYANDGGKPVELNVPQNMVLNTRLQFLVLYTAGPQARAAAVADVAAAVRDGALPVGEAHGLPLIRFPLDRTADAHRAMERGTVGKVLVDVAW
ncbi:Bifunctional protein: zinc-containing alcohol dehydrogenase; quinone oxidoreductase (NADPH:quinone reductase); Similar to arginate lyase [[Actinomadura] parvosata subsp. kistnae]|uniref:NADPH:quinone reductase n=1 Tax=[Actinomadura] parvosata subsp. kistnae TaxID=1909395 RepID=A0A1U9ZWR9_9ACTN|nr:NADPH:quinone reductase [Nonomuraea sp. ATCC 55076]AQZ62359.1 NADPH:quinone reductase [Nonomuraea sp. ATCC 55076]SPL88561.1 Bifunctional protein: zinc-containing alcohol dehydrogenase; quinone oxidoreductase (NADPH:quinone reductase); Similar to arginate lyase [Actinomadura parvosata subsp. kistnae]